MSSINSIMVKTASFLPHHQLPPPFNRYASFLLMENVENADMYLLGMIVFLIVLAFIQLRAFARPPPVPLKRLPRRPALSILFKPDDITSLSVHNTSSMGQQGGVGATNNSVHSGSISHPVFRNFLNSTVSVNSVRGGAGAGEVVMDPTAILDAIKETLQPGSVTFARSSSDRQPSSVHGNESASSGGGGGGGGGDPTVAATATTTASTTKTPETPIFRSQDLPDSFAPLLSSSQTELLLHHLTADLIHGVHVEAGIRMQVGRHEIPLDKDSSRPQLVLDVPQGGVRLSAVVSVGSDQFSTAQDLDVTIPTTKRSCPMVKHAGIVFDPPLPLSNVAPTLIHFPTLFEDKFVPKLRRIQIFRIMVDTVISFASLIEKCLWILESFLQIHLGKVRVTPVYKGVTTNQGQSVSSPEWRLTLAFSGHVQLFGFIPIPFINIMLPTFIIPQPHALLQYLMTDQPLASARLKRENIAEQRIVLALLDTADTWHTNLQVVATPPAVGIDLTLPGGVSLGMEILHGRDAAAGRSRQDGIGGVGGGDYHSAGGPFPPSPTEQQQRQQQQQAQQKGMSSGNSMSSWTTNNESGSGMPHNPSSRRRSSTRATLPLAPFDSNDLVPWSLALTAKGTVHADKLTGHLTNLSLHHEDPQSPIPAKSQFKIRGSFAVWKADLGTFMSSHTSADKQPSSKAAAVRRTTSFAHRAALAAATMETQSSSVAAVLLFTDEMESYHRNVQMLHYDYAFDVWEESKLDAITFSVGASHPMLNGGSMVTTVLESIYAHGSVSAREHAILDPMERRRKRNILRHLPAIDFTFGIQNIFIPPESCSYTDDGQTRSLPQVDGGRLMVRLLGGIEEEQDYMASSRSSMSMNGKDGPVETPVSAGIKLVADFGVSSISLNNETNVKEFPELEIYEGAKLRSQTSGKLGGAIKCHLRPQKLASSLTSTGPNIFNPLEAYEIDFSGSSLSVKIKESSTSLAHRRIILPPETTVMIKVVESVVDMALEGKTQCELSWDFQGLSPILQVTAVGQSPEHVMHENKEQVPILIGPLRQGRLNFHVSPVGGINITKAVTSREDKEGLYDWKFFNALVSPDEKSAHRLIQVIEDKRTMNKLLQVIKLVNKDIHRILSYILTQVWRAKEIFDQEGVSDPAHIIPGHRMARLISLFMTGDISQVNEVLPIIRRVVDGDGLDVVKVKELLRQHCEFYDEWASEIDRAVRWVEMLFNPILVPQPYVENQVTPLAELPHHASRFRGIPSAAHLYEQINDRPRLPLEPKFSNLVSRVAPYLSFVQIEYFLKVRASTDWQPSDLKRLRYVFSIKRKVMEIAESYGGLSFLPQSFLVSVFLGEATRSSMRATQGQGLKPVEEKVTRVASVKISTKPSTLVSLRQRRSRLQDPSLSDIAEEKSIMLTAAGRVASLGNFLTEKSDRIPDVLTIKMQDEDEAGPSQYELGDCLLGPADVAILLQAGLTSVMKGSSVVQLNQRMLLDLIASQPKSFAVAVLCEIGTHGGQGSTRGLTSALMALLELDQNSFRPLHRLDMHALMESWLPGLKVPRREEYMAGGRWARQSYYDAIWSLATNLLEDAECYVALKGHIQRFRPNTEADPIPHPRGDDHSPTMDDEDDFDHGDGQTRKLMETIALAKSQIDEADVLGVTVALKLMGDEKRTKSSPEYEKAIKLYKEAFDACAQVRALDKLAFQSPWFRNYYKRNYDALMIKSMYDNVIQDVDTVRQWLHALRRGAKFGAPRHPDGTGARPIAHGGTMDTVFLEPEKYSEQFLVDAIIDATIYLEKDREQIRRDPLVRLLIPNPPGKYDFTVVTAMGVITDGKAGLELQASIDRLYEQRGVVTVRADTATARSVEFNAGKIIEAIESARELNNPYGLVGYSQGCANALMAETLMTSGSPEQQRAISDRAGLVCRQLLFSAANGSRHGPAVDKKVQRLIVMVEEFFKYQQGYFSRAFQSFFLEMLNSTMDSAAFHKSMGGAQSFLIDGCRAFWREAQNLPHVPTCTLRGVLEEHTTPECLEMLSNMLSKQSGSELQDSQVHVFDAVGHPVYHNNRNGKVMERCDVGEGAIQRTHHWSPLREEVAFIATARDNEMAAFECAKDRHLFPWIDVNVRFGFIKYSKPDTSNTQEEGNNFFEPDGDDFSAYKNLD